eukprot:scaffold277713_cov15-Tisochrysis_lutea.AAC.2
MWDTVWDTCWKARLLEVMLEKNEGYYLPSLWPFRGYDLSLQKQLPLRPRFCHLSLSLASVLLLFQESGWHSLINSYSKEHYPQYRPENSSA